MLCYLCGINLPKICPHFFFVPICPKVSWNSNTHVLLIMPNCHLHLRTEWFVRADGIPRNCYKLQHSSSMQHALYLYQVCCTTRMYQVPVVVIVVTLTCYYCCCHGATAAAARCCWRFVLVLLYAMTAAAAPVAQYIAALPLKECRGTTPYGRRTP